MSSPTGPHGDGDHAAGAYPARLARAVVVAPIVVYRSVVSPALPRRCKYEPTCSRYAIDAVRRYGMLRGLVLAGWRLLRCNPWSYGGYDPVECQRVFGASNGKQSPREADGSGARCPSRAIDPSGAPTSPFPAESL